MKGTFSTHFRSIVVDSIIYGFRTLVSHIFLLARMFFVISAVNLVFFIILAGFVAVAFNIYQPTVLAYAKAYFTQCTALNVCSVPDLIVYLKSNIQDATITTRAVVGIVGGIALFAIMQCSILIWSSLAAARVFLDIYDSSTSRVARLFSIVRYVPRAVGSSAIVMLGFILVIIPALIVSALVGRFLSSGIGSMSNLVFIIPWVLLFGYFFVRIRFFLLLIIDRNAGAFQSIAQSISMTRGFTICLIVQAVLFGIVELGVPYIPYLSTSINMFIVYPIGFLSSVYTYRYIEKNR